MSEIDKINTIVSRRNFLIGVGGLVGASVLSSTLAADSFASKLAKSKFQLGCAAITWNGDDLQAIKDISSLGFRGIQLRANTFKDYEGRAKELKSLLKKYKLKPGVFSSGHASIDPAKESETIKVHVAHAKFLKEIGGKYLQVTNNDRPKDAEPAPQDLIRYGEVLTKIGKAVSEYGITLVYHNHMHQLGEKPEEVDLILQNSDEKYVKLLLDVAHYFQGGGNPAQAIAKYASRLSVVHLKDVKSPIDPTNQDMRNNFQFVELGEGKVDLTGIMKAINTINFKGWIMVELDKVPEPNRTPLQSLMISKKYLKEQLKISF